MPMHTSIVCHHVKNMPEITGIIDQIDAQGIAQTIDIASIL